MKRALGLLALLSVLLLGAVPVPAEDGFYVIATGPPPVGAKITSLPYTITTPGYYYLTSNLSYTGGDAITVKCDNVTIDLMGFRLAGPATNNYAGVFIYGGNNVEVRNGTLGGWYQGVYSHTGSRHRMINVRANGNTYGLYLNGDDHLIQTCSAFPGSFGGSEGTGLVLNGSGQVSGCTVMNFPNFGIYLGTGGTATGNLVFKCGVTGIYAFSGTAVLTRNHVSYCSSGIDSGNSGGSIIDNLVIQGTTGILPSFNAATPNVLDQNTVAASGTPYGLGTSATVWGLNAGR